MRIEKKFKTGEARVGALLFLLLAVSADPAAAYVGPGAGLGLLGAFFALAAGVILALVMTFLHPLRTLWRKMKGGGENQEAPPDLEADPAEGKEDQSG